MNSTMSIIAGCLGLPHTNMTGFVVACFYDYVVNFLRHHPNVLDPHFPQIKLRIALTAEHPFVEWNWTQQAPGAKQTWLQDEYATVFVLSIMRYLVSNGYCTQGCNPEEAIQDIHRWLCVLQSVWLQNGVWVDDMRHQAEARNALMMVMQKVEFARASHSGF